MSIQGVPPPSRASSHAMIWPSLLVALGALATLGLQLSPQWGGKQILPKMSPTEAAAIAGGLATSGIIAGMIFGLGVARLRAGQALTSANIELDRLQRSIDAWEKTWPQAHEELRQMTQLLEIQLAGTPHLEGPAERLHAIHQLLESSNLDPNVRQIAERVQTNLFTYAASPELFRMQAEYAQKYPELGGDQFLGQEPFQQLQALQQLPANEQQPLGALLEQMQVTDRAICNRISFRRASLPFRDIPSAPSRSQSHALLWTGCIMAVGALATIGIQLMPGWGGPIRASPTEGATLVMDLAEVGIVGGMLFGLAAGRLRARQPLIQAGLEVEQLREVATSSATLAQRAIQDIQATASIMYLALDLPAAASTADRLASVNALLRRHDLTPIQRQLAQKLQTVLFTYIATPEVEPLVDHALSLSENAAQAPQHPLLQAMAEAEDAIPRHTSQFQI